MKFLLFLILSLNINFLLTVKIGYNPNQNGLNEYSDMINDNSEYSQDSQTEIEESAKELENLRKSLSLEKRRSLKDNKIKQTDEMVYRKYCINNKKFCYFFG